jgi:hypothetical protein
MSAARKRRALRDWASFLKSGLAEGRFTNGLYRHLIGHCAFIARFNRAGFFATYFADPSATRRFLDQFDRSKGCRSTEYGDGRWIAGGDYCDVNAAMVDEASARLPVLRRLARGREIERARREIASGEATLARLLAEEEASR